MDIRTIFREFLAMLRTVVVSLGPHRKSRREQVRARARRIMRDFDETFRKLSR